MSRGLMLKSLVQTQNQTSYSLHLHFIGSKEQLFVSIGDSMASAGGLNLDPDTARFRFCPFTRKVNMTFGTSTHNNHKNSHFPTILERQPKIMILFWSFKNIKPAYRSQRLVIDNFVMIYVITINTSEAGCHQKLAQFFPTEAYTCI